MKSLKWLHFLKILNFLVNKVGAPLNYVSTTNLELPTVSSIVCMLSNRPLHSQQSFTLYITLFPEDETILIYCILIYPP